MRIVADDLRGDAIATLLKEHLAWSASLSPPASTHALHLDKLDPYSCFMTRITWEIETTP